MKDKMIAAFRKAEGGLFSAVEKADVGGAYQEMEKQGVALMGWADPFMPDFSMPKHDRTGADRRCPSSVSAPLYRPDRFTGFESEDRGKTQSEKTISMWTRAQYS